MKPNDSCGTNLEPWQHLGASRPAANDGQQVKKLFSLLRVILHPWQRLKHFEDWSVVTGPQLFAPIRERTMIRVAFDPDWIFGDSSLELEVSLGLSRRYDSMEYFTRRATCSFHVSSCPKRRAFPRSRRDCPTYVIHHEPASTYSHALTMASPSSALPTSRTFITQLFDSLSTLPSDQAAAATNDNAKTNTNPLNNLSDTTRKQLLSLQVVFPTEFVPALDLLDRRLVTRFHIRNEEQVAELETVIDAGEQQQDVHMMQDTTAESEAPPQQQQQEDAHARATPFSTKRAEPMHKDKTNHLNNNTIYYVRSAQQQRSSRFATSYDTTTYYQVRLRAWNCSCPAFAFSAFPATTTTVTTRHVGNEEEEAATVHTPLHNNSTTHQELNNNKDSNNSDDDDNADNKWIFGGISLVGKETTSPPVCKHLLACVFVERCKGLFGGFVEDREVGVEEAAGWAAGWGD